MKSEKVTGFGKASLFATATLFGIAVLVLLGVSGYAFLIRGELLDTRAEVRFFRKVSRELNEIRSRVLNVESSQRGYLITGSDIDLEGYALASSNRIDATRKLLGSIDGRKDLQGMFQALKTLIEERETDLQRAVALRKRNSDQNTVSEASINDEARRTALQIDGEFVRIVNLLEARQTEAESAYQTRIDRLMLLLKLAAFTALSSGLLGLAFLLGHMRAQQRAIYLEEGKRQAEKSDQEKSKFLASMNHEIRTPLNVILGFSELLDSEVNTDRGRRFLKAIRTSGESLAELINDILDLSKIESGALELDPEPICLREFTTGISVMFEERASDKGLKFSCHIEEDCPEVVLIDGLRMRQILINFIGNALKFTEHGSVELRISLDRSEKLPPERCCLRFEVKDTGRGVEPSKRELIFQPFKQAFSSDEDKGGTGLGLNICRELTLLMGGRIELDTEVGAGSTFRVVLPEVEIYREAIRGEVSGELSKDFNDLPPSKVLVVDDNPYNRELIGSFLEDTHHKVFYAENGADALNSMRETLPDLVLMDIRMPVMTGDEARQQMLEDDQLAAIPVIAVTASSLMSQERRLKRLFDGYLRKPFSGTRLFEGLRETLVRNSRTARENELIAEDGKKKSNQRAKIQNRKELMGKLENLHEKRWSELTSAMVFSDVFAVADEIFSLGIEHNAGVLKDYADEIRKHAGAFDQSRLEQLLGRFDHLIEEVKNQ